MTITELAEIWNVSRTTVKTWARRMGIARIPGKGHYGSRWPKERLKLGDDLVVWLNEGKALSDFPVVVQWEAELRYMQEMADRHKAFLTS